MSKRFFELAFVTGLLLLAWVAWGFVGTQALALAMTGLIAAVFVLGAWELRQFRAATAALDQALAGLSQPPERLDDWIGHLPAALQAAARARIEGQGRALPGPALTPYLVGLLVMLGMLGTFLGMVVTFKGAVFALEGSADLQAMRGALAEPIKGLGLSFGTSVAGVAASALLGLMSALARRERLEAQRRLDAAVATALRAFSPAHQREASLQALQAQAGALPQVLGQVEALLARLEARSQQLDEQLLARHERLQAEILQSHARLAESVRTALEGSLAAGARVAGESITPVVSAAMAQMVAQSEALHARLGASAQTQVEQLSAQFSATAQGALQAWAQAMQGAVADLQGQWQQAAAQALAQQQAWSGALSQSAEQMAGQLAGLGQSMEAPLARLLHTASEVPQAAAGVITQLREEVSRMTERDNLALAERTELLGQLGQLVESVGAAAGEQRLALGALVAEASAAMQQAAEGFAQTLQAQAGNADAMAAQLGASAVELAGVGEAFGQGVQQFQASSDQLLEGLLRVEAALARSSARSDEQLAYYVAQAREVIDLSISSQQGILESLQQLKNPTLELLPMAEGARA